MKVMLFVCVLAVASFAAADEEPTKSRGCIYIMGRCARECEEGTHAYALGCGYKTPEPTCAEPHPLPETAMLCDYSACYCDEPSVRDASTGKCVQLADCPKE